MPGCPYCRKFVAEHDARCRSCGLDLAAAKKQLGPVPLLNRGLSDITGLLDKHDYRSVEKAINQFNRDLPQCEMHVVLKDFDTAFPLATHLFWLFNTAGLSSQTMKGANNRDLLIGLDPGGGRVGIIPGYGLEPFLADAAIDQILEKARPGLEQGQYGRVLVEMIGELGRLLRATAEEIGQSFGLATAGGYSSEGEF